MAIVTVKEPGKIWRHYQCWRGMSSSQQSVPDATARLSGKWVLVTGGNNGIGREAALQFAAWGSNIVIACREKSPPHETTPDAAVAECRAKADAAGFKDTTIEWWPVDMTDLATVKALAQRYVDSGRPLDVLCNNAGIGGIGLQGVTTKDGFELVHQVNLLSHCLLALAILPALERAQGQPRVVGTASCMQFFGVFDLSNANTAANSYSNNKLYYQVWLNELRARLAARDASKHIAVHGIHPGFVHTGIWVNQGNVQKEAEQKQKSTLIGRILKFALGNYSITPQQGSLAILKAASFEDDDKAEVKYFNRTNIDTPMPYTTDPVCRKLVWEFIQGELKNFITVDL